MRVDLYTSNFCSACRKTKSLLDRASSLVSELDAVDHNVADEPEQAAADAVHVTPTTIVRTDGGREVFRAEGVPTLPQLLAAIAKAT